MRKNYIFAMTFFVAIFLLTSCNTTSRIGEECNSNQDCGKNEICNQFSKTCMQECYKEGERPAVYPGVPGCCSGLQLIGVPEQNITGVKGVCTAKCGNNVCDPKTENVSNCPKDCK